MNKKKILALFILQSGLLLVLSACQDTSISLPADARAMEVWPEEDFSAYTGKFITFWGEIIIPDYKVDCDKEIDGYKACPLHLNESPHILHIVMGSKPNNITSDGEINIRGVVRTDAASGFITTQITGLVRECDDQQACVIDIYQLN